MANPFVHIELGTTDITKAKPFYQALFNWSLDEIPVKGTNKKYTMIYVGKGTGGGMMENSDPELLSKWLPYVLVDDVTQTVEKALSIGATVIVNPTEVKDMGWYAVIVDPTGAAIGLWMNATHGV